MSSLGGREQVTSLLAVFRVRSPGAGPRISGVRIRDRVASETLWPASLWLAGFGLGTIIVQAKYFVYHWIVLFPPAILLVAIAIDELLLLDLAGAAATPKNPVRHRVLAYAGLALILAPLVVQPASDVQNFLRFAAGRETRETGLRQVRSLRRSVFCRR